MQEFFEHLAFYFPPRSVELRSSGAVFAVKFGTNFVLQEMGKPAWPLEHPDDELEINLKAPIRRKTYFSLLLSLDEKAFSSPPPICSALASELHRLAEFVTLLPYNRKMALALHANFEAMAVNEAIK